MLVRGKMLEGWERLENQPLPPSKEPPSPSRLTSNTSLIRIWERAG